jgi:hypothetical protein
MRLLIALLWLAGAAGGIATAENVPLPKPRPPIWGQPQSFRDAAGPDFDSTAVTDTPTDCDGRLERIAAFALMPRLIGPDSCGGADMVRLDAVMLAGGARVGLKPAPMLRCTFAESVASWLRDEAAPRVGETGSALKTVETDDDFECRGRNRVAGAKVSELARVMQSICAHSSWRTGAPSGSRMSRSRKSYAKRCARLPVIGSPRCSGLVPTAIMNRIFISI